VARFVETEWSEGGDADVHVFFDFFRGFHCGLCLVLLYEVDDLSEGLLRVSVGDAIFSFDDDEIGDLPLVVEDGLADGHIIVGPAQLYPHEFLLLQLFPAPLTTAQSHEEIEQEWDCCAQRDSHC
jgi:hypothetical protein